MIFTSKAALDFLKPNNFGIEVSKNGQMVSRLWSDNYFLLMSLRKIHNWNSSFAISYTQKLRQFRPNFVKAEKSALTGEYLAKNFGNRP